MGSLQMKLLIKSMVEGMLVPVFTIVVLLTAAAGQFYVSKHLITDFESAANRRQLFRDRFHVESRNPNSAPRDALVDGFVEHEHLINESTVKVIKDARNLTQYACFGAAAINGLGLVVWLRKMRRDQHIRTHAPSETDSAQ
jgi:hypothetical protein